MLFEIIHTTCFEMHINKPDKSEKIFWDIMLTVKAFYQIEIIIHKSWMIFHKTDHSSMGEESFGLPWLPCTFRKNYETKKV